MTAPATQDAVPRLLVLCEAAVATTYIVADFPLGELQRSGLAEVKSALLDDISVELVSWCDAVFLVRPASPRLTPIVSMLQSRGRKVFVYWDDDPFSVPAYASSYAFHANPVTRYATLRVLRRADDVLASSTRLAQRLEAIAGRKVGCLPVPIVGPINQHPRNEDAPVIGFAGSTDHSGLVRELLLPACIDLWKRGFRFRWELIGPTVHVPSEFSDRVFFHGGFERIDDWLEFRASRSWDVLLAPLKEGRFEACKFYNKVLEATAMGAAVVCSAVPPFSDVIVDGETGMLVENSVVSWTNALARVLDGSKSRRRLSDNLRLTMLARHSPSVATSAYGKWLESNFSGTLRPPRPSRPISITRFRCAAGIGTLWILAFRAQRRLAIHWRKARRGDPT